MSITFGKFWNLLRESEENSKSLDIIRSGLNLRKKDSGDFWDDFINLCGNSEAMSELLEVPKEKVTKWTGTINKLRDEVKNIDSNKEGHKNKVLKIGEQDEINS